MQTVHNDSKSLNRAENHLRAAGTGELEEKS